MKIWNYFSQLWFLNKLIKLLEGKRCFQMIFLFYKIESMSKIKLKTKLLLETLGKIKPFFW